MYKIKHNLMRVLFPKIRIVKYEVSQKLSNHVFYLLIYRETIIKVLGEFLEALWCSWETKKAAFTHLGFWACINVVFLAMA